MTSDIKNFEISESKKDITLSIKNSKIAGTLEFSKTDVTTSEVIEGATIEIKGIDESNQHIKFSFVSSKEGNKFSLPFGKYEFKELIQPEGYILSEEVGTFEIKSSGEIVKAELKNQPILTSIKVVKVDGTTNEPLTGAEFTLTNSKNELISSFKVDDKGIAIIDNLKLDTYFLTETISPENYQKLDKPIEVTTSKEENLTEVIVKNYKDMGELHFSKIDSVSKEKINGASIEVKGVDEGNKDIIEIFESSSEGNIIKLPLGKYEYKELKAPESYILSETVGSFEIKSNNEKVEVVFENTQITHTLKVLKVDSHTKKALSGAEFSLSSENGDIIGTVTSDENGVALFENLKQGTYLLTEEKSPTNYERLDKPITINITPEKEVFDITVENTAKLAQTNGDYTFNQLIFTGIGLIAIAFALSLKKEEHLNE